MHHGFWLLVTPRCYTHLIAPLLSLMATTFLFVWTTLPATSLIASVWFFGGTTMLFLGVLGIYVSTILSESKRRPYTVVRRVHRRRGDEESPAAPTLAES